MSRIIIWLRLLVVVGSMTCFATLTLADPNVDLGPVAIVSTSDIMVTTPGVSITLVATSANSEYSQYRIWLGGEYVIARCTDDEDTVNVTHTFMEVGVYAVVVAIRNNVSEELGEVNVTVVNPVTATLVVTSPGVLSPDGVLQLNIAADPWTQPLVAEDVHCLADYGDGDTDEFLLGDLTNETAIVRYHSNFVERGTGHYFVNVTCWNTKFWNGVFGSTTVTVYQYISGLKISPNDTENFYYVTGTAVGFTIEAVNGESGARYAVDYGDGLSHVFCKEAHVNFTVSHYYSRSGTFEVSVLVTDHNVTLEDSIVIVLQYDVKDLLLTAAPPTVLENTAVEYSVTFPGVNPPEGVTCEWSFADGSDSRSEYLGNVTVDYVHVVEYTHQLMSGGADQTTTVNCSNLVSNVFLTTLVRVDGMLTNLTLSVNGTSHVTPGESATFSVEALGGMAGVKYAVYFADGIGIVRCTPEEHEDFSLIHAYKTVGVYWSFVVAEDNATRLVVHADRPVVVQNPLLELDLTADTWGVVPDCDVTFEIESTATADPTNVTCTWNYPGGTSEDVDVVFVDGTANVTTVFGREAAGEVEVKVNCSNLVSNASASINLVFYDKLDGLTISADRYDVGINHAVNLHVNMSTGSNVTYVVDHGDGTNDRLPVDLALAQTVTVSYGARGSYNVSVQAFNMKEELTAYTNQLLVVIPPLFELELTADTFGVVPDCDVTFEITSTAPEDPLDVTCTWNYPGGTSEDVDVVISNGTANFSKVFGREAVGEVEVKVNCSNLVSNASASVTLVFYDKLGGLTIRADSYNAGINDSVNLHVNMSSGSNVTYVVDHGDGTNQTLPVDVALAQTVSVSYGARGSYNVSVLAFNNKEEMAAYSSQLVFVYIKIRDFTLVADTPKPIPPGDVVFTVTPHVDHIPVEQVMTWDFADGNVAEEADIVFDQVTPLSHSIQHTYTQDRFIGNTTVTLNISNPASHQLLEAEVMLVEKVGDVTVSPDRAMAVVGEDVAITVQIRHGSHVTYTANYGDGTLEETVQFDGTDVLNRNHAFTHAYRAPGDYYVNVTASNIFSKDAGSHTNPIHIPLGVYDLSLTSNTPVLTPPGNIVYTLDTSPDPIPPPPEVTCTWVYDDGEEDDEYHEILTLPQHDVTHVYRPTITTLKSELHTVVTCKNTNSNDSASTVVVINANTVELGKITTNHPKMKVEETIDITLSIKNYGYDPCFVFHFTGPEGKKVLYGRDECKTIKPDHDEYHSQDETDSIVYSTTFSEWGIFQVKVTAENSVSVDAVSAEFVILPERCEQPVVGLGKEGLDPERPRVVVISQPFSIHSTVAVNCDLDHHLDGTWNVTSADFKVEVAFNPLSFSLNMDAHSLSLGDYRITRTVTVVIDTHLLFPNISKMHLEDQQSMYVRVVASSLDIRIVGGDEVVAKMFGDIILTALPKDPDSPGNSSGMTLKWACDVSPEASSEVELPDWTSVPDFGFDLGGCFPRGDWETTFDTLTIPQETIGHVWQRGRQPTSYSFTVRVEKDERFAEHTQWMSFEPGGALALDITCQGSNCKSLISHTTIFMLRGVCLNCEPRDVITFTWRAYRETEIGSDLFEPVVLDNKTATDMVVFNTKNTIMRRNLIPGLHYKFELSAITDDKVKFGLSTETYIINRPPYGGECTLNSTQGKYFEEYQIDCHDWKDDTDQTSQRRRRKRASSEDTYAPLEYEVMVSDQLMSFSRQSEMEMLLPVSDDNNTLEVVFLILDEFMSPANDDDSLEGETAENLTDVAVELAIDMKELADLGDIQGSMQLMTSLLGLETQGLYPSMLALTSEEMTILFGDPDSADPDTQYSEPQGPATQDPGLQYPGTQDPGTQDPGTQDPGAQDPWVQGQMTQAPGAQDPETQDPGTQDPGAQDQVTQDPGPQGPGTQDPGAQDPGTQDPGAQGPGTQDPGAQDPGTQDPGAQDPGTQDPGTHDPGAQNPGTQDPGTQDPGAQDPGTQDPGSRITNIIPFHGFLIAQIAKLNPVFPREIQSTVSVLKHVSDSYDYFLVDSPETIVEVVDNMVDALAEQAVYTDPLLVDQLSLGIASITGDVTHYVATRGSQQYQECAEQCDENWVKNRLKEMVWKSVGVFRKSSDLLVAYHLPGEPFILQEEDKFTMIAGKKRGTDISAMVIGRKHGTTSFPRGTHYIEGVGPDDCLQFLYLGFKNNPYVWNPTALDVNSPVQQTEARDCDSGEQKDFAVVTPENAYKIRVPVVAPPNMTLTVVNDTATQLVLHFFETRDPTEYVQIFFDPSVKNMSFELFVGYDRTPDNMDFDYNATLPIYPPGFDIMDSKAVGNLATPFSVILPQNLTSQLGNFTVAVWIKVGGNAGGRSNYTFYIQYIKSRLFEWEDESWEPRGSEVEPESSVTEVRFKSTIFADSLGAGLFIGPNTIDFSTVFNNLGEKILDNIHVLVTIIVMVVVFVGLTPFARHMDKADLAMVTPAPILSPNANNSNNEAQPYQYKVDVYTGLSRGSGTDSKVYIRIMGNKSDTGVMPLEAQGRKNFKRGDTNSFVMSSAVPLGRLRYMRLFHDNSGKGDKASWFCEKVVVTERHSRKKYLFLVNNWFSVAKGDYKIDRTVPIATRSQLLTFKSLFPRRSKRNLTNDHMWISVFYKESEDRFSRVQRLGSAMAAIFMTMIADAMWYQRDESEEKKDGFNIGPFAFTLQALWVSVCSVLTVIPVTFVIVFFFKRSKTWLSTAEKKAKVLDDEFFNELEAKENASELKANKGQRSTQYDLSEDDKEFLEKTNKKKKKKGDGRFLPFWCTYVAWVMVLVAIVCSAFFTLLYSFEWGGDKSRGWLTAFLLSFTESEFLVNPVKAIVLAVIFSLVCKKLIDEDVEDEDDDEYANAVCRDDDENGPSPLTREQVQEARRQYNLEQRLRQSLRTLAYHVVFLIALILVTYGNRNSDTFYQNETMRGHFIRNLQYTVINSEGSFYDWMEQIVIPRLYMTEYNNWDPVVKKKDLRYTEDSMCYRLGPPQLRQYRVRPDLCDPVITNLNITCNVDYSMHTRDDGDYALGWLRLTGNDTVDDVDGAYVYRHDQDDETSYWGWLTAYTGGGYIANLGTSQQMAFENLGKLKDYRWFDRYTRAVIMEFNVYNANSNLFTMVSLVFEFPSYGAAIPREEIKTVKMYRYFGSWGVFSLATEVILILLIIFLLVKLVYSVSKLGCRSYFQEFWHRIELGKVLFTVIALVFYVLRTAFIKNKVEKMMNNRGQVVSFADVVMVDEVFINMIGAALFMQILQLLWVLQFNKSLAELAATISVSWQSLKSYFITLSVIFTAFAMVAYHIYGTMLWNYRDYLHTTYAQLISILGKFDTNEIVLVGGDIGQVFFMGYQLILLFIFINLLIAILNDTIADINSGAVNVKHEEEVIDLLIEKLGWGKKKKKEEVTENGEESTEVTEIGGQF